MLKIIEEILAVVGIFALFFTALWFGTEKDIVEVFVISASGTWLASLPILMKSEKK